ncbi:GGDEF domain-containing protein [Halovibrio salipaludis]|uniref:diguanylate cyclase n=2 Tax=Halovibrio salipaludis TaxID=2032626 RepID=A0A2A2F599_9GAMM|nr:GGDEF domain-containing protein [Halovibrio salipaludis]
MTPAASRKRPRKPCSGPRNRVATGRLHGRTPEAQVMTETALRTRTNSVVYALMLLCFMILAERSLRYGFYELFFSGLAITALAAAGIAATLIRRHRQLQTRSHLLILVLMALIILQAIAREPSLAFYWLYPMLMAAFLLLRVRQAAALCAAGLLLSLIAAWNLPLREQLTLAGTALLLAAGAGWFARHYHASARYVDTLTIVDPETGAYNERSLNETLSREISRSEATGHPLSMALLRIDHREELSGVYGEEALAGLSAAISQSLRTTIRAGDSHYHLGDGRFFLLLPFTPEEGLRVTAERVRRLLGESRWPTVESITASIGSTTRSPGETSAEALRQRCEEALGEAQRRGHDQVWHLGAQAHSMSSTSRDSTSSRSSGSSISTSD